MTIDTTNSTTPSRLPHRLATLLVCAVFPLIFVGGLVTTTEAGMAVPDWPGTFGYNLFLYPWTTWIAGPWDIFVEHGHRLLGAAAGMITIALAWSLWKHDDRPWAKWLGIAALIAVIGQGVLGGMRVVLDARLLAMTHACTGPLYFSLCVAIWYLTGRQSAASVSVEPSVAAKAFRLAVLTTCLAYLQLILGAVVRHMPVYAPPRTFHTAVMFHLLMAAILTVHVVLLAVACRKTASLRGTAAWLTSLLGVQLLLGVGTWVVNFGIPRWVGNVVATPEFTVRTQSLPQVLTTTAHVAVGSLIVVTSLIASLKAGRLLGPVRAAMLPVAGFALREVTA
jgi:cytochrome c oxidase assembly protein subunit 15